VRNNVDNVFLLVNWVLNPFPGAVYMVKERIAVTINADLLKWVDKKVKDTTFANRSHAVEHALTRLKDEEEKKA
jgi:hypothetical protein